MINLFKVRINPKVMEDLEPVIFSGYIGQGKKVDELEDLLQETLKFDVKPVTLNSCTSAITLALELVGCKTGDEAICVPSTCFASNIAPLHKGMIIKWADINPYTFNIDVESVRSLITEKTKVIICTDWAGRFCNFKELKKFGIPIIEDAAHVFDCFEHNNERGDFICYSMQEIKFLNCLGFGGFLVCPSDEIANKARKLRWFGLDRTKSESFRCTQTIETAGWKFHLTDVCATGGISNLPEAIDSVKKHKNNAKYLTENIKIENVIIPEYDETCSYWLFSIRITNNKKSQFIEYLKSNGIESSPVHYRNDLYECVKQFKKDELVGVDIFDKEQVCIPCGWWLSKEELDHIVTVINQF